MSFENGSDGYNFRRMPTDTLAALVMWELSARGDDQRKSAPADTDNHFGVALWSPDADNPPAYNDAFRLNSWVEDPDDMFGYALAISKPSNNGLNANLYMIDREKKIVVTDYPKQIHTGLVELLTDTEIERVEQEVDEAIEELVFTFDRTELEAILQMLKKAGRVFRGLDRHDVDPAVYMALAHENLDELGKRYARRKPEPAPSLEQARLDSWHDFMSMAREKLDEATPDGEGYRQAILRWYGSNSEKIHIVGLMGHDNELSEVHLLCFENGLWQSQRIELDSSEDDEDLRPDQVHPVWNPRSLLDTLQHGSPMPESAYNDRVREVMQPLKDDGVSPEVTSNVVYLKRSA